MSENDALLDYCGDDDDLRLNMLFDFARHRKTSPVRESSGRGPHVCTTNCVIYQSPETDTYFCENSCSRHDCKDGCQFSELQTEHWVCVLSGKTYPLDFATNKFKDQPGNIIVGTESAWETGKEKSAQGEQVHNYGNIQAERKANARYTQAMKRQTSRYDLLLTVLSESLSDKETNWFKNASEKIDRLLAEHDISLKDAEQKCVSLFIVESLSARGCPQLKIEAMPTIAAKIVDRKKLSKSTDTKFLSECRSVENQLLEVLNRSKPLHLRIDPIRDMFSRPERER